MSANRYFLGAIVVVFSVQAASANDFYRYFKTEIPLRLNYRRLLIRSDDVPNVLRNRVDTSHFDPVQIRQYEVRGWYEVEMPQAMTTKAEVIGMAERLSDLQGVFASPVYHTEDGLSVVFTSELFVRFHPKTPRASIDQALADAGLAQIVEREFARLAGVYRVRGNWRTGFDVLAAANRLSERSDVIFAEPEMLVTVRAHEFIPDDVLFARQWGLHAKGQDIFVGTPLGGGPGVTNDFDVDAPEAWDVTMGDPSIIVAVLDSGVQRDHPDMVVPLGMDFTGDGIDGSPVYACDNHGTIVAGVVGATANNGIGIAGLAPGCTIASAKVFIPEILNPPCTNELVGSTTWLINALSWAEDIGARVTVNSYHTVSSALLNTKFLQTHVDGMVHFSSTGNDPNASVGYPGNLSVVAAVAALDPITADLADFATFGPGIAFGAPGVSVLTTDRSGDDGVFDTSTGGTGNWVFSQGSSLAVPFAAGVAALVLSQDPTFSSDDVMTILQQSATDMGDVGYDETYGYGFVNAYAAVMLASEYRPPFPPFNDNCAQAIPIGEGVHPFSTHHSTNEDSIEETGCFPGFLLAYDIWYEYTASFTGMARIDLCDSDYDGTLVVYDGADCSSDVLICADDECGFSAGPRTAFPVQKDNSYLIRIGGFDSPGSGVMAIDQLDDVANDECLNALPIQEGDHLIDTLGTTTDGPMLPPSCEEGAGLSFVSDIWFVYQPECRGTATIDMCESDFDTRVAVYEGSSCFGELLACNDDAGCGPFPFVSRSFLEFDVDPFEAYLLRIGGFNNVGQGMLSLSVMPTDDVDCHKDSLADDCQLGDFDGDGTVGTDDYASWNKCVTGPSPVGFTTCCRQFDLDGDDDVDLVDFGRFQLIFGQPQ